MEPSTITDLALSLGLVVVPTVIGLTGAFKKFLPQAEPLLFSIPAGLVLSGLAWFATQPVPEGVAGWCAFVMVTIIGGLLPSGLFDAGVNMARKALKDAA